MKKRTISLLSSIFMMVLFGLFYPDNEATPIQLVTLIMVFMIFFKQGFGDK